MTADAPELGRDELRRLYQRSDWRSAVAVVAVLGGVALALGLPVLIPKWPLYVVAFVVVGGLQHHLLIVQHEALHYLLFRNRRLNEAVGALVSYLIFFTMAYRAHHFRHHRHLGEEEDPDLADYVNYPNDLRFMLGDFLRGVTGWAAAVQFLRQSRTAAASPADKKTRRDPGLIGVAVVQLLLFGSLAAAGRWELYLFLWIVPLVTLAKTLTHFRTVAEHARLPGDPDLERHRTILCGPIEGFFFAPLNFNYHAEHHLYMAIPFYNLPRAHRLLAAQERYREAVDVERGYVRFLLTKVARDPGQAAVEAVE